MSNPHDPETSPDGLSKSLAGQGGRGAGVRRLNRIPLMAAFGVAAALLIVVFYTMYQKTHPNLSRGAAKITAAQGSAAMPSDMKVTPSSGLIPSRGTAGDDDSDAVSPGAQTTALPEDRNAASANAANGSAPVVNSQLSQAQQQYQEARRAAQERYTQRIETALEAPVGVSLPSLSGQQQRSMTNSSATPTAAVQPAYPGMGTPPDPNRQDGKSSFLNQIPPINDYLSYTREKPRTPYDVKSGTVIPATMISGLSSDLPGQIIAQVRENVYDTATGKHLIIPQGSRLIGTYDSGVTRGQDRALTAWRRIIFPDGSSIDLGTMPGSDESGFAGFKDLVDDHYWRLLKDALLVSVFSAGIQLSQPQATDGQNITSQQVVSASIGQEIGQLGTSYAQRNLDIQPTITIRPGYQFNVMVTRDMVMPPWSGN